MGASEERGPGILRELVTLWLCITIAALACVFGGYIAGYDRGFYNGCVRHAGAACPLLRAAP